jgi:hypothetical protein
MLSGFTEHDRFAFGPAEFNAKRQGRLTAFVGHNHQPAIAKTYTHPPTRCCTPVLCSLPCPLTEWLSHVLVHPLLNLQQAPQVLRHTLLHTRQSRAPLQLLH